MIVKAIRENIPFMWLLGTVHKINNRMINYCESCTFEIQENSMRKAWSDHRRAFPIQHSIEVKSALGSRAFHRFFLRGLQKVSIEVGLFGLKHNLLKKVAAQIDKIRKEEGSKCYLN